MEFLSSRCGTGLQRPWMRSPRRSARAPGYDSERRKNAAASWSGRHAESRDSGRQRLDHNQDGCTSNHSRRRAPRENGAGTTPFAPKLHRGSSGKTYHVRVEVLRRGPRALTTSSQGAPVVTFSRKRPAACLRRVPSRGRGYPELRPSTSQARSVPEVDAGTLEPLPSGARTYSDRLPAITARPTWRSPASTRARVASNQTRSLVQGGSRPVLRFCFARRRDARNRGWSVCDGCNISPRTHRSGITIKDR